MVSPYDASIIHESDNVNFTTLARESVSGEAILRENKQVTKQFIKKHHRTITLPSTTPAKSGFDFIDKKNQHRYIIVQLDDINIHTELAYREGVAYRTNCSGELQRNNETHGAFGVDDNWEAIEEDVNAILVSNWEDIRESPAGEIEVGDWNLYVPAYMSGEVGDRFIYNSGEVDRYEVYKITGVDKGVNFAGVKFIKLDRDSR